MMAATRGHKDVTAVLLHRGAVVDLCNKVR